MKKQLFIIILCLTTNFAISSAQQITESDFYTNAHPRVFVTIDDRPSVLEKVKNVNWTKNLYDALKAEVDPIVAIHRKNPSFVISRMQMHWEPGKRYTHFYTEGNFIPRRTGNAKYPTVRVTYGRAASNSVPLAPLDKIISYGMVH